MEKLIDYAAKEAWDNVLESEHSDLEETMKKINEFDNALYECGLPEEVSSHLASLAFDSMGAHERQGFIYGFKKAVEILGQDD